MMREVHKRNFIIGLLILAFVLTGAGYGLGEDCQVLFNNSQNQESRLSVPTLSASGEIHTFQIRERSSAIMRYHNVKSNAADATLRGIFSFLCVLMILLVYFRLIHEVMIHYRRLYVRERLRIIFFIQDEDGRKRFS